MKAALAQRCTFGTIASLAVAAALLAIGKSEYRLQVGAIVLGRDVLAIAYALCVGIGGVVAWPIFSKALGDENDHREVATRLAATTILFGSFMIVTLWLTVAIGTVDRATETSAFAAVTKPLGALLVAAIVSLPVLVLTIVDYRRWLAMSWPGWRSLLVFASDVILYSSWISLLAMGPLVILALLGFVLGTAEEALLPAPAGFALVIAVIGGLSALFAAAVVWTAARGMDAHRVWDGHERRRVAKRTVRLGFAMPVVGTLIGSAAAAAIQGGDALSVGGFLTMAVAAGSFVLWCCSAFMYTPLIDWGIRRYLESLRPNVLRARLAALSASSPSDAGQLG